MPRKTRKKLARIRNAEMARHALNPLGARAPVADPGHIDAGRGQDSSREEIDPELASFCQRFNLEPQVQDFESDEDGDDADGPEIAEQSELEHFSAVLRHAQQVAIQLEREREISRKRKTPRQYTGNSQSQKTLYRRKKTKLQLAEKGFLGIFEYLDRHSQRANNRATSPGMTAMTTAVAGVTAANATAADATVAADMAAANTTTASSTAANTTPASTTAVNMATANTTATDTTATVAAAVNETAHDDCEHGGSQHNGRGRDGRKHDAGSWCNRDRSGPVARGHGRCGGGNNRRRRFGGGDRGGGGGGGGGGGDGQ
ncbi:hypothetical protein EDB85DRAFT_1896493 [Lactarius pseudohatsudake]|nr:hypothetical protein EDB85DRAFT_1896493 [Lactarius pseudohatsudake]